MEFHYEAASSDGQLVRGVIEASDEGHAMKQLQAQNLTPVSLDAKKGRTVHSGRVGRSVTAADKLLVLRELATLLGAGVALAEAVESIASARAETRIGPAFSNVLKSLRNGASFSLAMRDAQLDLPEYIYQLIEAGELTGKLSASLLSGADQMDYEQRIRQETTSALIYPTVLVVSGIAATLLIFLVVVPKFTGMLRNSRANLPAISTWVLQSGLYVKEHLLWFGLGGLGLLLATLFIFSNASARRSGLQVLAGLPLLGEWLLNTETGRWATMLGTLLSNRVPIVRAMELAEAGVRIQVLSVKLNLAVRDLRAGKKLADALQVHKTVSSMGLNLIRVGERTGELPEMLKTLGRIYENASRERMKRFLVLLEPLTILIVGCVIGVIMVAIMLAITSLSTISL